MRIRVNTYDGLQMVMEVNAEWRPFLDDVLRVGWIGCDSFWCGLKNLASIVQLKDDPSNVIDLPKLHLVSDLPGTPPEGGNAA